VLSFHVGNRAAHGGGDELLLLLKLALLLLASADHPSAPSAAGWVSAGHAKVSSELLVDAISALPDAMT
jgi:hypothetical protein